jgi:hypothetical protein
MPTTRILDDGATEIIFFDEEANYFVNNYLEEIYRVIDAIDSKIVRFLLFILKPFT